MLNENEEHRAGKEKQASFVLPLYSTEVNCPQFHLASQLKRNNYLYYQFDFGKHNLETQYNLTALKAAAFKKQLSKYHKGFTAKLFSFCLSDTERAQNLK